MRWRNAGGVEGVPRLAYLVALLVAMFGFGFRFLTLRGLPNDHYIYLSAAQQMLLGDLPGRDFVEPGMLLQFMISAAGQAMAPGLSTEAIITIGFVSAAAAATCIGISWLTRSVVAGTLAGLFQVLLYPRLYSFPKILVPAVLLLLVLAYAKQARTRSLALLACWIAVAFLLRHDIGAYAAIAGAVGVALSHRSFASAVRATATLTAVVLLVLLPYFAYLQWSGGIAEHVRDAFEYGKAEEGGFGFDWPVIGFNASGRAEGALPWDREDAAAFLFYCAYSLPVVSALLVMRGEYRTNALIRPAVASVVVLAIFYDAIILRHPIISRVPDLATVLAILGGWVAVALIRISRASAGARVFSWRLPLQALVAVLLAAAAYSVNVLAELPSEFDEARLLTSPSGLAQHAEEVVAAGRDWPWQTFWPDGSPPPVIEYMNACTGPDDRVWLTWPAPQYYVFARRGFGGGHPNTLSPHSYKSTADQDLVIARLDQHRVPIVLINESTRVGFADAYPRIDRYLRQQYTASGDFTIRDGSVISIAIRHGLKATDTYGPDRWPCRFVPDSLR
jgi:hypothetical protein